ncbi:MAG TPA: complex I subunit 1 family protein [Anaeromyxobacter sp.]|nr:complex I subunit 1 family protein [Anaeromyxobacter sp.]
MSAESLALALGGALGNLVLALALAPLFQGVQRRLTARVQSRRGPPLLQPYFDLLKLLGKEDLESGEAPAVQRLAAYLSLATVLATACLVPLGFPAPLSMGGDVILLLYLLLLSGVCTLLAGAAAGSTYSWVGVSREMMTMMTLEPILAVALGVGALHARSLRLEAVLCGSPYDAALPISGALMLGVMLFAFQAYAGRAPFDVAEAETEIMDGPLTEYSGQKLALFRLAQMVKLVVYAGLFVALFVPWGSGLPQPLAFVAFWAKALVLVVGVALVAATHARFRVDQAVRRYSVLLAFSLGAIVLAALGR